MTTQKVAVVTGSNKGIGYEIVKGLCKKFTGAVYLTSRDVSKGREAVKKLKELGFNPLFHQLDITDQTSIDKLKEHLQTTYGGLDLLVNNAAFCFKINATEPFGEQAVKTLEINYYGTLKVCDTLFPILKNNAKVVNVSSSAGHLSRITSADLRKKIGSTTLTVPELNKLVEQFLKDAKANTHIQQGWGDRAYAVSKVAVSALTFILQRQVDAEKPNRNISVNAVHPGYVTTDMTSHHGPLSPEEGAKAPLFVALEADFKGKYVWYDSKPLDWYADSTPSNIPAQN